MVQVKMTRKKYWIQDALKGAKKGALRRQLQIPEGKRIPLTLLDAIISADVGDVIVNPTKTGKRRIHVTRLLERRAILARNLLRLKR